MIRIGDWLVRPETCTLEKDNKRSHLPPRAMDVLVYLSRHPNQVISTEELLDQFWPASASDHAVHKVLATLRRSLGDSSQSPVYIKTYPKRGYALIADVFPNCDDLAPEKEALSDETAAEQPSTGTAITGRQFRWQGYGMTLLAVAVLGVSAVGAWLLRGNPGLDTVAAQTGKLVVVEPVSYFGESESTRDLYLANEVRSALMSNLSRNPAIKVIKSNAADDSDYLQAGQTGPGQISHRLNTQVVELDGALSINVELENAVSGEVLYSDQLFSDQGDILVLQDQIVDDIASSLNIVLDEEQFEAMHDWGTGDTQAYQHFLKAEFHKRQWNQEDWAVAIDEYQQAIALDPSFLNAYTGLATAANYLSVYSNQQRTEALANLLTEYRRQLELINPESQALELVKSMLLSVEGNHHRSLEKRYRRQILSGQAPAYVFAQYGLLLQGARMYREARQYLYLAANDDPYRADPNQQSNFLTGVLTPWDSIEVKKQQLIDQPAHVGMLGTLIGNLSLIGEFSEAEFYLLKQSDLDSDGIRTHLSKIYLSHLSGELRYRSVLQGGQPATASKLHYPDLLAQENLQNPDLQFNYGVMALMDANLEMAELHWRRMTSSDTRKLVTRLHAAEVFFPDSILESPEYWDLLEQLGAGKSWQHQLMEGVKELQQITGIGLNPVSREYFESSRFMYKNNHWSEQDWQQLSNFKNTDPGSGVFTIELSPVPPASSAP